MAIRIIYLFSNLPFNLSRDKLNMKLQCSVLFCRYLLFLYTKEKHFCLMLLTKKTAQCFITFPHTKKTVENIKQLRQTSRVKVKNDPRSEFSNLSNWKEEA